MSGAHARRREIAFGEIDRRRRQPSTCTRPPCCPIPRLMCGLAGIVRPAESLPVSRGRADANGARLASPWARWLRPPARRGCRPGLVQARDLRPSARLAAPGRASRRQRARLQRRGLQPPGAPRRAERGRRGFQTTSDTEVVHRLLERDGLAALDRLNGQFAFAWWEPRRTAGDAGPGSLRRHAPFTTRCFPTAPWYSARRRRRSSRPGRSPPEPDLDGIDDVFTLWGVRPPRSAFAGVRQVPAGGVVVWERGRDRRRAALVDAELRRDGPGPEDLEALLRDSVRLRLRADVPVGTYLSGGLDSSLLTALAQEETEGELRTFSVAFRDRRYDERAAAGTGGCRPRDAPCGRRGGRRARSPQPSPTRSTTRRRP